MHACACAAGALAPGTAPAMADELAGFTHCRDLSPGLMQMHWKARRLSQHMPKMVSLCRVWMPK